LGRLRPTRRKVSSACQSQTALNSGYPETLGNTPAVCRSAYICPDLLDSFERGTVIERYFETVEELVNYRGGHLHQAERALLRLLKRKNNGNGRT
jgi:DNA topoisomerase IB